MDTTTTEEEFSNVRPNSRPSNIRKSASPHRNGQKNLRFFGDTDLESNASVSKAATFKSKPRKTIIDSSTLAKSQKYSQSAFDLNTMPRKPKYGLSASEKHRSSSLQNLEDEHQSGSRRTTARHVSFYSFYALLDLIIISCY